MSSPLEQPGGSNEPTWGEGGTREGSMKQHFHKEQLEGASDQASEKGTPHSLELGHAGKMAQSDAAGGQQSAATSNLSEAQAAEPEMTESVKRTCRERAPSPVPSVLSMRSEGSMVNPLNFKAEDKGSGDLRERPVSPMSGVSMCDSDKSNSPNFAQEGTRLFLAAGGVQCDACHNPAVKACLTCRDSYCQSCIRPHYCDPDLERHQLQDLQHQDLQHQDLQHQGRCEQHNKKLKFYCRTDQSAICSHCFLSHNGHDIIDLDTAKDQTAHQTQIKKEGVPPPGQIQFLSVQPNSVTLRWSPPEGAPGAYRYRVTWRRGQDSRIIEVVGPEVEVGGLLPGEKYHFSVITLGEDGHWSTCVERSVHTEAPIPKNLTVNQGSTCVSVTWAKPDGLMDKVSYLLQLFKKEEQVKSILTDDLDFNISGLQHDVEYTVHLSTILPKNCQSKPTSKHFRTEIPVPQHLTVSSITASSARLSWEASPEMEQIPLSFLLSYWHEGTEPMSISTELCCTDITGLKPGTDYNITVCAELQYGGKSKTAFVQFTTGFCLADLLQALNLNIEEKIKFSSVLEITGDMLHERPAQTLTQLPWVFLRRLMMCNLDSRNVRCTQKQSGTQLDTIHPLDLITAVLLCSDPFLQQEMFSKMAMCQFAVPLLLPNGDTQQSTLMLWAMRDIVKIYRPHSLAQDRAFVVGRIVEMDIPMVSFVRLGRSSLAKSQILNKLLNNPHQYNNTFIHRDMECGDVPRRISHGLVEVGWYLPGGNTNIDKFTQPVAMANLRGDGRLLKTHMSFLCQTSVAVFIFSDDLEGDLSTLANRDGNALLFLVTSTQNINMESLEGTYTKVIVKAKQHETEFMEMLWSCLTNIIKENPATVKAKDMVSIASSVGFPNDEDNKECINARENAVKITKNITDIEKFKMEQLPLHGEAWKKISEFEKELCRMKKAEKDIAHYRSSLWDKKNEQRELQHKKGVSDTISNFIAGITQSETECLYFLKWLKIQLDYLHSQNQAAQREQHKECENTGKNMHVSSSPLGLEHFFRELSQLYECACSFPHNDPIMKRVQDLPALCAQLLLDGFPVELLDGDASNIPIKWISEVLTQLHKLVDSKSRILVLTVLGVQGTGKSTLLNNMFGVQFAVSSGRCTRGASMLLIKVAEELRPELGCDFFMVIDTEGLQAPELAELDKSYEHDNELATLVVGLSDISIVNIAMETSMEMRDILQIVVHAFLRMKEVGKKPRCVFTHQNMSDLTAHINNMKDRKKLVEQLNEMTRAAARMEKLDLNTNFTDVMDYDPVKDSYYIPGLWQGTPPMAPVNTGYSEAVFGLKKSLILDLLKNTTERHDASEFLEWTQSLWDAVKCEDFIFNFRNSLVAEAYTQLCSKYNKWDWSFQRHVNAWLLEKETYISNFEVPDCKNDRMDALRKEQDEMLLNASKLLDIEAQKLFDHLEAYFSKKDNHVVLVEKYKEDFKNSVKCLRKEMESFVRSSLKMAIDVREDMEKANEIKNTQTKTIEREVLELLQNCRKTNLKIFTDEWLDLEFEKTWKGILAKLSCPKLETKNIHEEVLSLLKSDFVTKAGHLKKKLNKGDLKHYAMKEFTVKAKWFGKLPMHRDLHQKQEICKNIILECENIVLETVHSKNAFCESHIKELLGRIDEVTMDNALGEHCEVALKLHVCSRAVKKFQEMHDCFIETRNPQRQLELSKSKFKEEFKDLFHERDQCQKKAKEFTEDFLRPAVQHYVDQSLGSDIVDEMLQRKEYETVRHFQCALLKHMLLEGQYLNYKGYTDSYAYFVKMWIKRQIHEMLSKDDKLELLQKRHFCQIVKKITEVLHTEKADEHTNLKKYVLSICRGLKKHLVFSKDVKSFLILNTAKTKQFSIYLEEFVREMSVAHSYDSQGGDFHIELLPRKPHEVLFKRVSGCGQQCPFCKTPCDAGGKVHKEHCSSMHRPQGLGRCRWAADVGSKLTTNTCTSLVKTKVTFQSPETNWKFEPMKKYKDFYPNWKIKGDAKVEVTDYWKYVLIKFNKQIAEDHLAEPADIPQGWKHLTQDDALKSLKYSFGISTKPYQHQNNIELM